LYRSWRRGFFSVIVGTVTYTTSQDWSLVDGFYFAVATLTTSSIADPHLVLTGGPIKIFTVFYILVGIGSWSNSFDRSALPTSMSDGRRRRRKPPRQTTQPKRTELLPGNGGHSGMSNP
jgi:hypothetical protein